MGPKHFEILEGSARVTWRYRLQVWDSWYEHKLDSKPDRTYYRNSRGSMLAALNKELNHSPPTRSLPDQ